MKTTRKGDSMDIDGKPLETLLVELEIEYEPLHEKVARGSEISTGSYRRYSQLGTQIVYLRRLQLTEEKCRLLIRVTELLLVVLAEDNDNNGKITFADKCSLKQLLDMVNSANTMEQLADVEDVILAHENYIQHLLK